MQHDLMPLWVAVLVGVFVAPFVLIVALFMPWLWFRDEGLGWGDP